jgi:uncharacterized protein (DUF58 family)
MSSFLEKKYWYLILFTSFMLGLLLNLPLLMGFSTSAAVIIFLAQWWTNHSLDKVIYRRHWHYRRGFPGEETPLKLEVENQKLLPLTWLNIEDPFPLAASPKDENMLSPSHISGYGTLTNLYSLRPYGKITRDYTLVFRKRGFYDVGPARLESGDMFGLYQHAQEYGNREYLTVFPEIIPLEDLNFPKDDPLGNIGSRQRLYEDPNLPTGTRQYHPEDGLRWVNWAATARSGDLQVNTYQPITSQLLMVCMDVSTAEQAWMGVNTTLLESIIKVCASVAYYGIEKGYSVGLLSNGTISRSDQPFHIPAGRSPDQLSSLLQALAGVTSYRCAPFATFLYQSLARIAYGATLVVVTGLVTPALCESLIHLQRYRPHLTLASLDPNPITPIPGVRVVTINLTDHEKV